MTDGYLSETNSGIYFNKINSITRLGRELNAYTNTYCTTYTVKGEFNIQCKSSSNVMKVYSGTYKLKLWSNG